jgi:hypothetical protein
MADSTRKTTSRPANAGEVVNAPQKRLGALTERSPLPSRERQRAALRS